jgi:hypothetical protein
MTIAAQPSATPDHPTFYPPDFSPQNPDPLKALQVFPYRQTFYPLGFPLELETTSPDVLAAANQSWGDQSLITPAHAVAATPALKLRLGVTPSLSAPCAPCPPSTVLSAHGHLLSIVADQENSAVCDLSAGQAFAWVTQSALANPAYLRYHFLEAIALCLLSATHVTPLHGACVSLNGKGILLCGHSGAGKSTLAYACARAGWTFTSDDASYLLWNHPRPTVRGNAHQLRFRPSARTLFPEIAGHPLTPRTQGKPSIEIPTRTFPHLILAPESPIHAIVFLHRQPDAEASLSLLPYEHVAPYLEDTLFPLESVRRNQTPALRSLFSIPACRLNYDQLAPAIACLETLTQHPIRSPANYKS